jgi:hypothetical protein
VRRGMVRACVRVTGLEEPVVSKVLQADDVKLSGQFPKLVSFVGAPQQREFRGSEYSFGLHRALFQ